MKITYIHQHFKLPSEGGGSRPYEFARRMAEDGHEVTMICGGSEAFQGVVDGINIKKIAAPYQNAMSNSERIRSFVTFSLRSIVEACKAPSDIIYASSTPLTVAVPAVVAKFVRRVPMVFEVRDLWPSVPIELGYLKNPLVIFLANLLEKFAYANSSSVVALSPGMKKGVLDVSHPKEVEVIPNACDFDMFGKTDIDREEFRAKQGWKPEETVLVYAGGFGPTYDLEWAIRLAAEFKDDRIRIVLIGEGKDSYKLHELAVNLGVNPQRILLGMKPKAETANFVRCADIVLSCLADEPCLEVNSLNKVFDGLAAGRPIVFNHNGWLKDAVVEAEAGWYLGRSIPSAARKIEEISLKKEDLLSAGRNSSQLGKAQFDRDKLYKRLITLLEKYAT